MRNLASVFYRTSVNLLGSLSVFQWTNNGWVTYASRIQENLTVEEEIKTADFIGKVLERSDIHHAKVDFLDDHIHVCLGKDVVATDFSNLPDKFVLQYQQMARQMQGVPRRIDQVAYVVLPHLVRGDGWTKQWAAEVASSILERATPLVVRPGFQGFVAQDSFEIKQLMQGLLAFNAHDPGLKTVSSSASLLTPMAQSAFGPKESVAASIPVLENRNKCVPESRC